MLDRKTPPPFQKSNSFVLLKPEKVNLHNGLNIMVLQGGEQDVTKIEFIFKAGKWHEAQPGVSYFTTHLLQKGTTFSSSFQISSELDQYGVHLEVSPGFDFTSLTLYGLTKHMERLLELIYQIITEPTFPEIDLQQTKDIYIQGLKINLEKTSFLASRQLRKTLFGENHPYGRDAEVQDIEALKRSQLFDFHQNHFGNVDVICSGNYPDKLIQVLANFLNQFTVQLGPDKIVQAASTSKQPVYLSKENTVQTSIRLGKRTISRSDADYPVLLLLNHVLGGYFGSRLMKNIREEKGLTYGIYSSITALMHDSFISIGAEVNKENRDLVITEIKKELNDLRTKLISGGELETCKNHFIGSLQAEITTPFAHADKLKNILLFGLPDNFYQRLVFKIDALTEKDILEAAQKYFDEESFSVVTAG